MRKRICDKCGEDITNRAAARSIYERVPHDVGGGVWIADLCKECQDKLYRFIGVEDGDKKI